MTNAGRCSKIHDRMLHLPILNLLLQSSGSMFQRHIFRTDQNGVQTKGTCLLVNLAAAYSQYGM